MGAGKPGTDPEVPLVRGHNAAYVAPDGSHVAPAMVPQPHEGESLTGGGLETGA